MFEDREKNRTIILGAYKKLKSYFYYDKTILYNKMRFATWEANESDMNIRIDELANFLSSLETKCNYDYLRTLISNIGFVPMPKSFEAEPLPDGILINKASTSNRISKVNFFIKAPVELMILDTIWMLMIAKIATDQDVLVSEAYANRIKKQLFTASEDLIEGVDFLSNRLFVPYFKQYTSWRDNAFKKVNDLYKEAKDSILISLDVKSYYYSVSFTFDSLQDMLNNDSRLTDLAPLTSIVEMVYMVYTSEMKKYREDISANFFIKQCIFPIGLLSSMLLSNLYLQKLDTAVVDRLKPSYYGRYVDDIMIVLEKEESMKVSLDSILYESLVRNNIIKPIGKDEYQTIIPAKLVLQKDKMRCIYFDHEEPDALIKLLCEAGNTRASGITLMPDINLSQKTFDESAYSLGQQNGTLKVRNFLFSTNNYAATLYVNDLIRTSKSVDVRDESHQLFIRAQINQILKFYSGSQAIEYRSGWVNIFTLMLINQCYDSFCQFYNQIYCAINKTSAVTIDSISQGKTQIIRDKVRLAMIEQLNLAVAIAIAPMAINSVSEVLLSEFQKLKIDMDLTSVFQDSRDIRHANMFNSHVLSLPLINYVIDDDTISLIDAQPKDIIKYVSGNNSILPLYPKKQLLSPRFMHLDEICMLNFLTKFTLGGAPSAGCTNDLISAFYEINHISPTVEELATEQSVISQVNELNLQRLKITDAKRGNFQQFHIAIASICLDEKGDIIPTLEKPQHNLTPSKKAALYSMLNQAVENGADMIVFPEFFLPVDWLEEIFSFSRKNSVAIVSGLRYIVQEHRAFNYLAVIQPFSSHLGFKYALPLIREKNNYAPAEFSILKEKHLVCKDPEKPYTHLIEWNQMRYSDMMCFELTDIEHRCRLRSQIELLLVPELNPDTEYFSNIVESTSRDLHCYVAQVNTSKYGDSRITGPYNSMFKDIVKIKGGENDVLLMGTIDIKALLDNRKGIGEKVKKVELKRTMKNPPAGFSNKKGGEK